MPKISEKIGKLSRCSVRHTTLFWLNLNSLPNVCCYYSQLKTLLEFLELTIHNYHLYFCILIRTTLLERSPAIWGISTSCKQSPYDFRTSEIWISTYVASDNKLIILHENLTSFMRSTVAQRLLTFWCSWSLSPVMLRVSFGSTRSWETGVNWFKSLASLTAWDCIANRRKPLQAYRSSRLIFRQNLKILLPSKLESIWY